MTRRGTITSEWERREEAFQQKLAAEAAKQPTMHIAVRFGRDQTFRIPSHLDKKRRR